MLAINPYVADATTLLRHMFFKNVCTPFLPLRNLSFASLNLQLFLNQYFCAKYNIAICLFFSCLVEKLVHQTGKLGATYAEVTKDFG